MTIRDQELNELEEATRRSVKSNPPSNPAGGHHRFYELLNDLSQIHSKKNTDYAAGSIQGPLGNFKRAAIVKSLYPGFDWDTAFGTAIDYMLKQLDAMLVLRSTKRQSVTGEPIGARLKDVAVYALIAAILEEEEQRKGIEARATIESLQSNVRLSDKIIGR